MSKPQVKPSPRRKPAKHRAFKPKNASRPSAPNSPRGTTKHERVLSMLRSRTGATIAAMVKKTGWRPHSVRGFLAGVVKKKLGLTLISEKKNSVRVYRVAGEKSASTGSPDSAPVQLHA
jgi:uncharacterized protein DUF3489